MRDLPDDSHPGGGEPERAYHMRLGPDTAVFVNRPKSQGGTSEDRVATMSERSSRHSGCARPNPGGFAALCQMLLSSLPMTIRDPAPNVGVPSVAPPRQRGLRSAETELCLAAAFRRGVGNCTRSRVLTMLKP